MIDESHTYSHGAMPLHDQCNKYVYHHVVFNMKDGSSFDGIIENVGPDSITVLVGEDVMEREDSNKSYERQYYGGGYWDGYGYGRPRRRFRRFGRQIIPIAALASLALLPYAFAPYPAYPYYPYY